MSRLPQKTLAILSAPELKTQILSFPPSLFQSFNLLLETEPDRFEPATINFSLSGEAKLNPGFDYGLDLTVRASPETWERILSGRATLLSEFFRRRVRFRNQRTAWNRFCLLSFFLAKK